MKKLNRRFNTLGEDEDTAKHLPLINTTEFSTKINDLLDKVSVQNRYASRISQCNMKNMQELQKAKRQLQRIAEQKKMDELVAGDNKTLMDQMSRRVYNSQQELKELFKDMIAAKREIKNLKKQIVSLEKDNLQLQKQLMQVKRQKYYQVSAAKQQIEDSLLLTHITNFLSISNKTQTTLYQFCLQTHKNGKYKQFFFNLDHKIQNILQIKDRSASHTSPLSNGGSRIKLKIPRYVSNPKGRKDRIKTDYVVNEFNDLL